MFRKTCLAAKKLAEEKNLFYKALSVLLAVLLWFFASSEREIKGQERVFDQVPVQVRGLKEPLLLLEEPPPVQVVLRGEISGLSSRDVAAFVNLGEAGAGEISVPVQVEVPSGVTVAAVKPAKVKLYVDKWEEKPVAVRVELQGTPQTGYRVLAPAVKPVQVVLRGGASILARVQEAVAMVDVDKTRSSFQGVVPVRLAGAGSPVTGKVECVPALVEVTVPIISDHASKTVPVQLQLSGSLPAGVQIVKTRVEPDAVKAYGLDTALLALEKIPTAALELGELGAALDKESGFSKEAGERSVSFSLPLVLPPGIEVAEPEKVLATVVLSKTPSSNIKGNAEKASAANSASNSGGN